MRVLEVQVAEVTHIDKHALPIIFLPFHLFHVSAFVLLHRPRCLP